MRFDPKTGFDAEAYAVIERLLRGVGANDAAIDAAFIQLEYALGTYVNRSDAAMEREHIAHGLDRIESVGVWLRAEQRHPSIVDDDGATRRALEALGEVRAQMKSALAERSATVSAGKGRADAHLRRLYANVVRIWLETGGSLGVSDTTGTGGRFAEFMTVILTSVGRKPLTVSGLRKLVQRLR